MAVRQVASKQASRLQQADAVHELNIRIYLRGGHSLIRAGSPGYPCSRWSSTPGYRPLL